MWYKDIPHLQIGRAARPRTQPPLPQPGSSEEGSAGEDISPCRSTCNRSIARCLGLGSKRLQADARPTRARSSSKTLGFSTVEGGSLGLHPKTLPRSWYFALLWPPSASRQPRREGFPLPQTRGRRSTVRVGTSDPALHRPSPSPCGLSHQQNR